MTTATPPIRLLPAPPSNAAHRQHHITSLACLVRRETISPCCGIFFLVSLIVDNFFFIRGNQSTRACNHKLTGCRSLWMFLGMSLSQVPPQHCCAPALVTARFLFIPVVVCTWAQCITATAWVLCPFPWQLQTWEASFLLPHWLRISYLTIWPS